MLFLFVITLQISDCINLIARSNTFVLNLVLNIYIQRFDIVFIIIIFNGYDM